MERTLRVALALVLAGAVAVGAALVFFQVSITLVFRDVPTQQAVLAGALAAAGSGGAGVLLVRAALRWPVPR